MIIRDESTWTHEAFLLHDCVADNLTLENGTLTFFFSEGILISEKYAPMGRHTPMWQSGPTKLSFSGADLCFFNVYSNGTAREYDLCDVVEKVAGGEWCIEFVEEYRAYHKALFRGCLRRRNGEKISFMNLTFALYYDELTCEWDENDIPDVGVEIFADNLHFLGTNDDEQKHDICLHGDVTMRVNGHTFADKTNCCVTASALRFLRSLGEDHIAGEKEFLFPCCGNTLIPSEDGTSVTIVGCPFGKDLSVTHVGGRIEISGGGHYETVSLWDYTSSVMIFAKQVLRFLQSCPDRVFDSENDKKGYEAFLCEYKRRMSPRT